MAAVTVRNIDESTRDRLKARAAANGRSIEAEARVILQAAVSPADPAERGLGSRIAALFADLETGDLDFERNRDPIRAATFEP